MQGGLLPQDLPPYTPGTKPALFQTNPNPARFHYRDLGLFSTLFMAREFISDYAVTISRDRIVVPELAEKTAFFSHVRNGFFKN